MPMYDERIAKRKAQRNQEQKSASAPASSSMYDERIAQRKAERNSNEAFAKTDPNQWVKEVNSVFNSINSSSNLKKEEESYWSKTYASRLEQLRKTGERYRNFYTDSKSISQIDDILGSISQNIDYLSRSGWSRRATKEQQEDYAAKSEFNLISGQKEIDDLEAERQKILDEKKSRNAGANGRPYAVGQQDIPDFDSYTTGYGITNNRPYAVGQQVQKEETPEDTRLKEIDQLISQKKQYLNQAKHIQDINAYDDTVKNADFDQYDDYVESDDDLHNWINDAQFRESYESRFQRNGVQSKYTHNGYDRMTASEIAIYNYYYAKSGKEAAQKYLDTIQERLNERTAEEMYSTVQDDTAAEIVFGVSAGFNQFGTNVANNFKFKDDYIAKSAHQIASEMVREDLGDEGKQRKLLGGNTLWQVAYDTASTIGNMAPSILASYAVGAAAGTLGLSAKTAQAVGSYTGSAMMGVSAAGGAYQQALNEGYDKNQARGYSMLVGASEMAMEKLLGGISAVGGNALGINAVKNIANADTALKAIAKRVGGSALSEFGEEYLQEVLDPVFSNIMLKTDKEVKPISAEAIYSGILGMLTGAIMESPSAIYGEAQTASTGRKLKEAGGVDSLAKIGNTFAADTVAYKLAGKVNENTGAYTIGQLLKEVDATLTEQNVNEIAEALMKENIGEIAAKKYAQAFAYVVEGGAMPDSMVNAIEADTVLAKAAREVLIDSNTTWNQRTQGYNEVLKKLAMDKVTGKKSGKVTPANDQQMTGKLTAEESSATQNASDGNAETAAAPKVSKIQTIEKGKTTVKLDDGTEVDLKDAALDPEDSVRIETIASVDGMSAEDASTIYSILKTAGGKSAQMDALGAKEAYKYGYYGLPESQLTEHAAFANSLTETQRKAVYEIGQKARQKKVENTTFKKSGAPKVAGKVHFDGDRSALNERQQVSLKIMDRIAEVLGVQIYVFESKVGKNGKRIGENGWYDPKDGSIHIDLYAGATGEATMLFTLAHELTHYIRQWSPQKFKVLADFLMEEYGKKGVRIESLIREQQAKAKRNGRTISYDTAYEEVVADSMEMMLSDGNVMKRLEKLKAQDKDLWSQIKRFVDNMAAKIREVYKGLKPDSKEAELVQEMDDAIYRLQELFAEGLVEASENFQTAENNTTEDGGVKMHARRLTEEDLSAYLRAGTRANKSKVSALKAGQQIILTSAHQIKQFINNAIDKKLSNNTTVAYGKVNDRLADDVLAASDGNIKIKDNYLELIPDNLQHAYEQHHTAKQAGDIDLQRSDFENIPEYLDSYTEVVYAIEYSSGKVSVCVSKRLPNGRILLIETVSKSRGALQFKNAIGVSESKYQSDYVSVYKKRAGTNTRGSNSSNNSLHDSSNSKNSIRDDAGKVNEKTADIRYSDRDTESVSNRSLLANAMESLAKTELEKKKLLEYKEKIDQINAEEQKLSEVRAQIKELSFAKGPRDKEKLRALRDEAIKLSHHIGIYDKQLLRLEASKPLQNVLDREKAKAYQRGKKNAKTAMQEYKQRSIENHNKTIMRHKIQNVVKELNSLLLTNDKKRHVPDNLKKAVAAALDLVNMDTVDAENRAAKYADLIAKEQAKANPDQDKIDSYTMTMENILRQGEKMGQRIKELHAAYEEIQNSDDPDIANAYDPVIAGAIQELSATIGNTSIKNMTMDQLSDVYDVYRAVLTRVRDANKAMAENIRASIEELAKSTIREVQTVGGAKKYRVSNLDAVRKFDWNNLKPVYAMERIGSSTLTEVFNNVRAGEDTWAKDVSEAREYYLEKSKKYGYDKWDFDKKYRFESNSGIPFELTLEQILSLYAYSKREQAADHLRLGGFVFDSNIETYMEKDGKKSLLKYKVNTADAHQITPEIMADIIGKLSKEQAGFVDEMQDYLSTVMGAKGNEVTSKMYGVKLFKEKFYFPLKSAKQFMFEQNEVSGEVRIKNSGFTNKVVAKANNPVILSNFMDVWSGHVNDMSMYHAFTLPLEDFNRVFNYNSPKRDGVESVSVKGTIQDAYSPAAVSYVKQLITDLNGGARTDSTTGVINKLTGMFKKGAVFASLSVVVQQPSAIARAAALVDTKYFFGPKVDQKRHKYLWAEVKKYAPVAIIKEMGYFDTNMGKSTQDFITGKEYSGIKEQAKAVVTDSAYRDELLSKAPALADEYAWCSIWAAVKRETKAKHPSMDTTSEAFLKLAGKRFTEVITKTQVYDSVLARSANMRSKDTGMKMATAFMAEPTTSINMIEDAIWKAKRGDKKYAGKAIGAVIASQILNSILVSFVYAGRDDDEDETYAEKYIGALTGSLVDGLNVATYIPFIKDIVSIMQGYDVERSDMAVVSDLWNAWKNLKNDKVSPYRKVENFAGSIAQIFGLPVKNIMRDVRGIYNTITNLAGAEQTTGSGVKYAISGAITGKTVSDKEQLYKARLDGDKQHAARVAARYDDEDSANAAVRAAIKDSFMADEIDEATALKHMVLYAGMDGSEAHWTMDAWKYRKKVGSDEGYGKYGKFHDAVRSGKNLESVIKEYTDNGVKASTLTGEITEEFKPVYLEASNSEKAAMKTKLISAYVACDMEREDAEKKLESWDFESEYGFAYSDRKETYLSGKVSKETLVDILIDRGYDEEDAEAQVEAYEWEAAGFEDVTTSAIRSYNEWCEPVGIPKSVYLEFWRFDNSTENDVDKTTGKPIAYSAVKKIMAYIDSLNLTDRQKDALAKSAGWADKTIQKYKLW